MEAPITKAGMNESSEEEDVAIVESEEMRAVSLQQLEDGKWLFIPPCFFCARHNLI